MVAESEPGRGRALRGHRHEVREVRRPRRLRGEQGEEQHGGCPRGVSDDVNDVVHTVVFNDLFVYILLFRIIFVSLRPEPNMLGL
jgi:hypothetical protein